MFSSLLPVTYRFAASQVKRRLFSNVPGSAPVGSGPTGIVRRKVTLEERAKIRAARKRGATFTLFGQGPSQDGTKLGGGSTDIYSWFTSNRYAMWSIVVFPTAVLIWGLNDENGLPSRMAKTIGLTDFIADVMESFSKPAHNKLLPDWSMMPNVPHDIPVPHTLVLDLENTLVSSTWDRKYGWRHAKRPGVDKFLLDMAQYYEIVLYSPSLDVVAEPVVNALDKNGCIMHRLYRDATYYKNGVHVKDLSSLNRDVNRMVVLDDDPLEVLQPQNLIRVKPFLDPTDFSDRTLARITPFLIEIARENYQDIPALLSQYSGMDADQIADEFDRRVLEFKKDRELHWQRGFAGLARRHKALPSPELKPVDSSLLETTSSTKQLTSKDLVGPAPEKDVAGSGFVAWMNKRAKEKEDKQKNKLEQWNEVMQRRHKQQQEAEKKAKEAARASNSAQTA